MQKPKYLCLSCLKKIRDKNDVNLDGPYQQTSPYCDVCESYTKGTEFPLFFLESVDPYWDSLIEEYEHFKAEHNYIH